MPIQTQHPISGANINHRARSARAKTTSTSPNVSFISKILIALLVLGLMFTRPTVFGQLYTPIGLAIMAAASIGLMLQVLSGIFAIRIPTQIFLYFAAGLLYLALRMAHADSSPIIAATDFSIIAIGAFSLGIVCLRKSYAKKFYDYLYAVLFIVGLSIVVTTILQLVLKTNDLTIAKMDYRYIPGTGRIFAPFTFAANNGVQVGNIQFTRLSGIFREPGIVPPFLCWAAAWAAARRFSLPFVVVPLLGAVASFSSLGLLLAVVATLGIVLHNRMASRLTYLIAGVAAPAILWITYYAPYIGLAVKTESGSISARQRSYLMENALSTKDVLFGDGLKGYRDETISLFSQISQSGIIYFSLCVLILVIPARNNFRFFVAALLPGLITVLFSQPIALNPIFVAIFLSWVGLETGAEKSRAPSRALRPAEGPSLRAGGRFLARS